MLTTLDVVTQELNHKWQWWISCASALPWESRDFPSGSVGKESAWNAGNTGDLGSIPRSGRFSGVGNGNPLQYSCMENAMDRGAWLATVRGVTKSCTLLKRLSTLFSSRKTVGYEGQYLTEGRPRTKQNKKQQGTKTGERWGWGGGGMEWGEREVRRKKENKSFHSVKAGSQRTDSPLTEEERSSAWDEEKQFKTQDT